MKTCTFMATSVAVLLRMRNVPDKIVEKIKKHFFCVQEVFFRSCAVYEIM